MKMFEQMQNLNVETNLNFHKNIVCVAYKLTL